MFFSLDFIIFAIVTLFVMYVIWLYVDTNDDWK